MALSIDQIMELARRAALELTEEEANAYAADIGDLEEIASVLLPFLGSSWDVLADPAPLSELREDRVERGLGRERLLTLSSRRRGDCIAVPVAVK